MNPVREAGSDCTRPRLWRAILFPTDFGPAAREAWAHAVGLGRAFDVPVRVLHVVELVPGDLETYPVGSSPPMIEQVLRRTAEAQIETMRSDAAAAGVTMRAEVVVGRARREILRAAREAGAILIVMGTCGRKGLGRAILGSVTQWVVERAPCPVLTVRPGARGQVRPPDPEGKPGRVRSEFPQAAAA